MSKRRTLKFRAYDTVKKEWLFGYEMPNLGGFNLIGEVTLMGELNSVKLEDWNHIDVMQFTGLLDKTGKEIFEGDIITATAILEDSDGYDSRFQIQGQVQYNDEYSAFAFTDYIKSPVEQYAALLYQLDQETIEVIGSIHDNPDLP
jgi:uncharacterized phage protein (TIGR01671 family)